MLPVGPVDLPSTTSMRWQGYAKVISLCFAVTTVEIKDCLKYMSQCMALQAIEKGRTVHTYAYGTAQYHWGISPKDKWVLFDVKKDPGCKNDLADKKPGLVAQAG